MKDLDVEKSRRNQEVKSYLETFSGGKRCGTALDLD